MRLDEFVQEVFVSKVKRWVAKTNKLTKKKKRGWHTEESMARILNWSKFLLSRLELFFHEITVVMRFCILHISISLAISGGLGLDLASKNPRSYIKSVVAYCRKPGNEAMIRWPSCNKTMVPF